VTLGDRIIRATEGFREPQLRFRNGRLAGSGGCNAVGGDYAIEGSRLRIGKRLASTMMACPEPVASLERDFLAALARVTRFRVRGDRLDLYDTAGGLEAHLQAVWLE
jgi:heat shock protein HslJ